MKITAIAFVLAMSAGAAAASPVSATISAFNLSHIHQVPVATLASSTNQTLNDFLLNDVRPALRSFTDKTDFEGCGELAYDSTTKTFSVILSSSQSHLACAVHPDQIVSGSVAMNATVHSHGHQEPFSMNHADKIFAGMQNDPRPIIVGGEDNEHFSPTDFAGGAGYLATPTTVRFQNGSAGSECDIKLPTCKDHT